MKFKFKKSENTIAVYLNGRLDVHLSKQIEKDINILMINEMQDDLIVNLQDVEYLSSSGIATLLSIMYKLKSKGKKFVLCNLHDSVKKVLDIVEMSTSFQIFKTENEAFEFLQRKRITG